MNESKGAPSSAASQPGCRATWLCALAYVAILLLLPPVGWWLIARSRWSDRVRNRLTFATAMWFGMWPLLAVPEVRRVGVAVLAMLLMVLLASGSGFVWVCRRVRRSDPWPLASRVVGGLLTGLLVAGLIGGSVLFSLRSARDGIKAGMSEPAAFGPAHLDLVEGLPILHLYGTPEEMGRQYGTILGPALRAEVRYFDLLMPRPLYRHLRAQALARERRLPDRFRRELKAIADAADVPYEVLLTANLTPKMHCTVLLAWGTATADGGMIFARNSEYFSMGLKDCGTLIIVWHPGEGMAQLSMNFLGLIGTFNGANEAGLCYGNLVVFNPRYDELNEAGLPIQFVMREAAGRLRSADDLRDHLLSRPAIMPVQVALADATRAHIVELGTRSRGARTPAEGKDCIAAGNFFHADRRRSGPAPERYHWRYDQLIAFAEANDGTIDAANITTALYNARARAYNIHAMVFEPARMKMHASFNRFPAAAGPFVELDLEALFSAPPAKVP